MFFLNSIPLAIDTPFTVGGVQYPANWLRLASPEERAAIGITEVAEQSRPDDRYYWVTDNGDGTYTSTPKDLGDCKHWRTEEVKTGAGSILSQTDWLVVRFIETEIPVPQATHDYRAAVRAASNTFEAQIAACATVDALAQLTIIWPE